jgi:hypothetical protein
MIASAMSNNYFKLGHEIRGDVTVVSVQGTWSADTAIQIFSDVLTAAAGSGKELLLVDVRELVDLTTPEDNAVFADAFPQLANVPLRKIAIVDHEINRANNDMLEASARRQGINARWFYALEPAERWLAM